MLNAVRPLRCLSVYSNSTSNRAPSASLLIDIKLSLSKRISNSRVPLPISDIYFELTNKNHILLEFFHPRRTRRLASHSRCLSFLRRHNVLLHSLLYFAPLTQTWNTTSEFNHLSLFGSYILKKEIVLRILKLFPELDEASLEAWELRCLEADHIASCFDEMNLSCLFGSQPPPNVKSSSNKSYPVPADHKQQMFLSILGELHWFVSRTKSTDRSHNNALFPPSDVLALHVICSHLLECLVAEIVFRDVEPLIDEIKAIWVNEPMSLPRQLTLEPKCLGIHSLTSIPVPPQDRQSVSHNDVTGVKSLSGEKTTSVKSTMSPKFRSTKLFSGERSHHPVPLSQTPQRREDELPISFSTIKEIYS